MLKARRRQNLARTPRILEGSCDELSKCRNSAPQSSASLAASTSSGSPRSFKQRWQSGVTGFHRKHRAKKANAPPLVSRKIPSHPQQMLNASVPRSMHCGFAGAQTISLDGMQSRLPVLGSSSIENLRMIKVSSQARSSDTDATYSKQHHLRWTPLLRIAKQPEQTCLPAPKGMIEHNKEIM